ncbi:MAG: calcium/sodium antiporter [Bacteroidales bacterium]|jgi:cation:H+ antiporter
MIEYFLLIVGLIALIKGADFLIDGSSSLAKKLGISTLVIGLTVVAFGTSTPELVVNIFAAFAGNGDIAFGNIIGSNMANILLILGVCALITQMKIQHSTIWKEIPLAFIAVLVVFIFSNVLFLDNIDIKFLTRSEGLILIVFFIIFLSYVYSMAKSDKSKKNENEEIKALSNFKTWLYILGGLVALYFGGQWTVNSATTIARSLGISEFLIASTIIAVGTSLPELVTSVKAAMKNNIDLAVGNVVGSNIFNVLWILGITAVINPVMFPKFIVFDLIMLLVTTGALFAFIFIGKRYYLTKLEGIAFLLLYLIYLVIIILRG